MFPGHTIYRQVLKKCEEWRKYWLWIHKSYIKFSQKCTLGLDRPWDPIFRAPDLGVVQTLWLYNLRVEGVLVANFSHRGQTVWQPIPNVHTPSRLYFIDSFI